MKASFNLSGEAEEDSMMKKICKAICAIILLVLSVILAMGYYQLAGRAAALNDQQDPTGSMAIKPYDQCDTWTLPMPIVDLGLGGGSEMESLLDDLTNDLNDALEDLNDSIDDQLDDWSEDWEDADWDAEWDEDWDAEWEDWDADATLDDASNAITDTLDDLDDWIGDNWGIDLLSEGTGWTMMYNFNTIFFLILAVQALLMLISAFVAKLKKLLGCLFCCCTCPVHTVMVIMALAYRYDNAGESCAMNNQMYDLGGNTFANDANQFGTYAVLAISTWIVFCCLPCCILSQTPKAA